MKIENEIVNLRAYAGALRESVNGQSMMATSPQEVASHIEVFTKNVEIAADIEIGSARLEGYSNGLEDGKLHKKIEDRFTFAKGFVMGFFVGFIFAIGFYIIK